MDYELDITGVSPSNLITNEYHTVTAVNNKNYYFVIPRLGPYYAASLVVKLNGIALVEHDDYAPCLHYIGATRSIGIPVYAGVEIFGNRNGTIELSYQTIGGEWLIDATVVLTRLATTLYNPRTIIYDEITNKPSCFPPVRHDIDYDDITGQQSILDAITGITNAIGLIPAVPVSVLTRLSDLERRVELLEA